MSSDRPWWRSSASVLGAAAIVLVVLAELTLGGAPGRAPDLVLFLGRFHPLVVHLPIGIFVLVALGEACTLSERFRSRLDPVFGLVLPLMVASALAAFVLGHLLAKSGDFAPNALLLHRRLALVAVMGSGACLLAWAWQSVRPTARARVVYRVLLFGSLGVMSLGAHFGGTMTRGEAYLSKYAPALLKPLLGGSRAQAATEATTPGKTEAVAEPLLFEHVVLPILRERCVECHGAEKVKGGLRLDTLELAKKGGESGAAIAAGAAAESLLVKRMRLPLDDDDHMPPQDKPQVLPEEAAIIEFWIDRGASSELEVRDALAPANARTLLEKALRGSSIAPTAAPLAPPAAPQAQKLESEPKVDSPAPLVEQPTGKPADAPRVGVPTPAPVLGAEAILTEKCEQCHGERKRKGRLRVDSVSALLAGGSEGPAIVAGRAAQSPLIQRIRLPLSAEGHMPPDSKPQLTAREIAVLVAWVERMERSPDSRPRAPSSGAESLAEGPGREKATEATAPVPESSSEEGVRESKPESSETTPAADEPTRTSAATAPPSRSPDAPKAPTGAVAAHGGCAACSVGAESPRIELYALASVLTLAATLSLRRRRRCSDESSPKA